MHIDERPIIMIKLQHTRWDQATLLLLIFSFLPLIESQPIEAHLANLLQVSGVANCAHYAISTPKL